MGRFRDCDLPNSRIPEFPNSPIPRPALPVLLCLVLLAGLVAGQSPVEGAALAQTPTTVPFLHPPFAGKYRITSYFDHHTPDHSWDDTIVIFNGDQASAIDGIQGRTVTFRGGYWFPDTTWYIYYDGHNGVDYGTPMGVTILAAARGKVIFAGSIPSSCDTPLQYVSLEHENGYRTYYLHLSGVCVRQGEWVEAGDPLGMSGNSGCSTGPHLHFGVERDWKAVDPFGWRPADRSDPMIAYSGAPSTWLWVAPDPSAADGAPPPEPLPALTGKLVDPPPQTKTNGGLFLRFEPDESSPPLARVEFWAYYADAGSTVPRWRSIGADDAGSDGWTHTWDTRAVPEGVVWLHAWATGVDGRVGKGSPIRADITIDRHPPLGAIIGLEPGSTAGSRLWLYAASSDPASTTQRVTFLVRPFGESPQANPAAAENAAAGEWREIGDARWLHSDNWLLEWSPFDTAGVADGERIDVVARLIDGAGNIGWTQPVAGVTISRDMPGGQLVSPASGIPVTRTLDLRFLPLSTGAPPEETAPIAQLAFYVWHDGGWQLAGVDHYGDDGWSAAWDPSRVADQRGVRVQARVYDDRGRLNTTLQQVTDLTLDRTPPSAGYLRPRSGGVARPDVDQRVWAWDGGSGVARVEFFVDVGRGWVKIGEDNDPQGGWSLSAPWGLDLADGLVNFSARVYDRAGNERWTEDQRGVALDRTPPQGAISYPLPGMRLGGAVTVTLEVMDKVSGLDRAIFYARVGDRWRHLGSDAVHADGLSLAWDTTRFAGQENVTLTAWVYDRAGNVLEVPHVEGLAIGPAGSAPALPLVPVPPSPTVTPTASATPSPVPPTVTPTASATPSPTSPPPTPSQTPTSSATPVPPTDTPLPTPTATPSPTLTPTAVPVPLGPPVHPGVWYLLGGGALVAVTLMVRAWRKLNH